MDSMCPSATPPSPELLSLIPEGRGMHRFAPTTLHNATYRPRKDSTLIFEAFLDTVNIYRNKKKSWPKSIAHYLQRD